MVCFTSSPWNMIENRNQPLCSTYSSPSNNSPSLQRFPSYNNYFNFHPKASHIIFLPNNGRSLQEFPPYKEYFNYCPNVSRIPALNNGNSRQRPKALWIVASHVQWSIVHTLPTIHHKASSQKVNFTFHIFIFYWCL